MTKTILRVQTGFIISGHNLNGIKYIESTVMIVDKERKLQKLLDRVDNESEMKALTINYKKTEFIFVSKTDSLKYQQQIENVSILQV